MANLEGELEMLHDAQKPTIIDLSIEEAYEVAETLSDRREYETDSLKVIYGRHAIHGLIYLVIPPLGMSLLLPLHLPVANQALSA